jgi:hypothetical protein
MRSSGDLHAELQLMREAHGPVNRQPWPVVRVCAALCQPLAKRVMALAALETGLAPSADSPSPPAAALGPVSYRKGPWFKALAPSPRSSRRMTSAWPLGLQPHASSSPTIRLPIGQTSIRRASCRQGRVSGVCSKLKPKAHATTGSVAYTMLQSTTNNQLLFDTNQTLLLDHGWRSRSGQREFAVIFFARIVGPSPS